MSQLLNEIISNLNDDIKFYSKDNLIHKAGTNMWDCFDNEFFEFIKKENNWENFRINGLTCGLETGLLQTDRKKTVGSNEYNQSYSEDEKEDIISRYKELKKIMKEDSLSKYVCSKIGNPRHLIFEDSLLNFDDLYNVYAYWQIKSFFNPNDKFILEIGAGYGNLPEKFIKNDRVKYFIIDLPESLIIQHYYLKTNHPYCKIQKIKSVKDKINPSSEIILIPCFFSDVVENLKFDLIINMRSFGEMNKEVLNNYFKLIEKVINNNGLLYTVNRYVTYRGKEKIKFKNYPFGNKWSQIISQPQWLQTHLHELLLERNLNPIIPFQKIIKSYPERTPPPGPLGKNYKVDRWMKNNGIT